MMVWCVIDKKYVTDITCSLCKRECTSRVVLTDDLINNLRSRGFGVSVTLRRLKMDQNLKFVSANVCTQTVDVGSKPLGSGDSIVFEAKSFFEVSIDASRKGDAVKFFGLRDSICGYLLFLDANKNPVTLFKNDEGNEKLFQKIDNTIAFCIVLKRLSGGGCDG